MVETNVLNSQLQTGEIEMPTVYGAMIDSGEFDVTPDSGEQNVNEVEDRDNRRSQYDNTECHVLYDNTKCHQGTQTELFAFSVRVVVVHKKNEVKQDEHL